MQGEELARCEQSDSLLERITGMVKSRTTRPSFSSLPSGPRLSIRLVKEEIIASLVAALYGFNRL